MPFNVTDTRTNRRNQDIKRYSSMSEDNFPPHLDKYWQLFAYDSWASEAKNKYYEQEHEKTRSSQTNHNIMLMTLLLESIRFRKKNGYYSANDRANILSHVRKIQNNRYRERDQYADLLLSISKLCLFYAPRVGEPPSPNESATNNQPRSP